MFAGVWIATGGITSDIALVVVGDCIRFSLDRDSANDTTTGDMYVLAVEIRDGA